MKRAVCILLCLFLVLGALPTFAARPAELLGVWYAETLSSAYGTFTPAEEYRLEFNRDKSALLVFGDIFLPCAWDLDTDGEASLTLDGTIYPVKLADGNLTIDGLTDPTDPFGEAYDIIFSREQTLASFPGLRESESVESQYGAYTAILLKQGGKIEDISEAGITARFAPECATVQYAGESIVLTESYSDASISVDFEEAPRSTLSYLLGGYSRLALSLTDSSDVLVAQARNKNGEIGLEIALKREEDAVESYHTPRAVPAQSEEELFGTYRLAYYIENGALTEENLPDITVEIAFAEFAIRTGQTDSEDLYITDYADGAITFGRRDYSYIIQPTEETGMIVMDERNDSVHNLYYFKAVDEKAFVLPQAEKAKDVSQLNGVYDVVAIVYKNATVPYIYPLSLTVSDLTVTASDSAQKEEIYTCAFEDGALVFIDEQQTLALHASSDPGYAYLEITRGGTSMSLLLRSRDAEPLSLVKKAPERELTAPGDPVTVFDIAFENDTLTLVPADVQTLVPSDCSVIHETLTAIAQDGAHVSMVPEDGLSDILFGRTWAFDPTLREGDREYGALRISKDGRYAKMVSTNPLRFDQVNTLAVYRLALSGYDEIRTNYLACIDAEQEAWNMYAALGDRCNALAALMGKSGFELLPRVSLDTAYEDLYLDAEDGEAASGDAEKEASADSPYGEAYQTLQDAMKSSARQYRNAALAVKAAQSGLASCEKAIDDAYEACLVAYGYRDDGTPIARGEAGAIDASLAWIKVDPDRYNETAAEVFEAEYLNALISVYDRDFKKWLADEEHYIKEFAEQLGIDTSNESYLTLFKEISPRTKDYNLFYENFFLNLEEETQSGLKHEFGDKMTVSVLSDHSGQLKIYNELFWHLYDELGEEETYAAVCAELDGMLALCDSAYGQATSAETLAAQAHRDGRDTNTSRKAEKAIQNLQKQSDRVSTLEADFGICAPEPATAEKLLSNGEQQVPDGAQLVKGKGDPNAFENAQTEPLTMEFEISMDYASGQLRLRGGMQDRDLKVTVEIADFEDLDAELLASIAEDISGRAPHVLSVSPTLNSGFVELDGKEFSFYEGEYHQLHTAEDKGVEDIYGNAARAYNSLYRLIGFEGVVYSHDGRYAAICNYTLTMGNSALWIDPVLFDLATGERILTNVFDSGIKNDRIGVRGFMTNAAFSKDDKYFYYTIYGSNTEIGRFAGIYRYDIENSKTEMMTYLPTDFVQYNGYAVYPGLALGADGAFYVLTDRISLDQPLGVARISADAGNWTVTEAVFPDRFYSRQILWSEASDLAICSLNYNDGTVRLLSCFRLGADLSGASDCWAIDGQTFELVHIGIDDLNALPDRTKDADPVRDFLENYATIWKCVLSPDGRYALLLAGRRGNLRLLAIRLCDMAAREVHIDNSMLSDDVANDLYAVAHIEWRGGMDDSTLAYMSRSLDDYALLFKWESIGQSN